MRPLEEERPEEIYIYVHTLKHMLMLFYGAASQKSSHTLQAFLIFCACPSEFESFLINSPELSGNYQQRHLVANQEKLRDT
jgi:hypothetical protein